MNVFCNAIVAKPNDFILAVWQVCLSDQTKITASVIRMYLILSIHKVESTDLLRPIKPIGQFSAQ